MTVRSIGCIPIWLSLRQPIPIIGYLRNRGGLFGEFRSFHFVDTAGWLFDYEERYQLVPSVKENVKIYTYSARDGGDFHAGNIRIGDGTIVFDFVMPEGSVADIELGVPVEINIENAVAAMAIAWLNGVSGDDMRRAMASFKGAKRRFEFWVRRPDRVMIDDYAHHPDELKASIRSVKALYPGRRLSVISSLICTPVLAISLRSLPRRCPLPTRFFC